MEVPLSNEPPGPPRRGTPHTGEALEIHDHGWGQLKPSQRGQTSLSCSPEDDRPGGGQGAGKICGYGEELGNGQIGPSPAVTAFELPPDPALVPEVAPLPVPEQVESRTGQVTAPMAQPTRALKSSAPAATEEGTGEVTREEQVALAVDMHGDGATQQENAKAGASLGPQWGGGSRPTRPRPPRVSTCELSMGSR